MWADETKSCVIQDGCSKDPRTDKPPCSASGTRRCISSVVNLERGDRAPGNSQMQLPFVCVCYPGHMGARCELPRDACIEVSELEINAFKRRMKTQVCYPATRPVEPSSVTTVSLELEQISTPVNAPVSLKGMRISNTPTVSS